MKASRPKKHRGIALIVVLSMVVLIALAVAFAINVAGKDTRDNAKQIHNLTLQNVTEGALQQARAVFSAQMLNWDKYLGATINGVTIVYPVTPTDSTAVTLKSTNPELFPAVPSGFACFIYAKDDADEIPPATNNPTHDNNHTIYIGAVCSGPGSTTSELTGVLSFDDSRFKYASATPAN
ncbi:MAG TPA: hypothetical protein VH083_11525 [Myxococcales bacterium]|jgi:Tfp pilus assembly protein PilV|nr:hypothetical protein [Myxococcales bacterium]